MRLNARGCQIAAFAAALGLAAPTLSDAAPFADMVKLDRQAAGPIAWAEPPARDTMEKSGQDNKKKKKKKKKGPHSSINVNQNGARVRTGGQYGSVSVGPNGPSASVRPGGGPVRIGIGPNGKPNFGFRFGGGR